MPHARTSYPTRLARMLRALPGLARPGSVVGAVPTHVRFIHLDIGASTRYRVHHHVEQARLAGLHADTVLLENLEQLYDCAGCSVLIFHRTPLILPLLPLLLVARLRKLPVVFDTDDLVWDARERSYSFFDQHHDPATVQRLLKQIRQTRRLMQRANQLLFSTTYLAERAASDFHQPCHVHTNALSQEQLWASDLAYRQILERHARQPIVIGYFAGYANVHDEDMASIATALAHVLDQFPQVKFRIYGQLNLRGPLASNQYAAQIEHHPAVDWRRLPHAIAAVDINIAPLIDNPQRRGKSAIKYLEAAAVGVPTIASALEPYQHAIIHETSGLLASTPDQWSQGLSRLIESPALRQQLGETARQHVLRQETNQARAAAFGKFISTCIKAMV